MLQKLMKLKVVMLSLAVMSLATTSCMNLLGGESANYESIPPLEQLDFGGIVTASNYDYWELRLQLGGASEYNFIGAGGDQTRDQLSAEVITALENATAETGFDVECMPAYCYKYIVSVRNGQIQVWNTTDALQQFLGQIDSAQEAALLAMAFGYYWDLNEGVNGIRETDSGYELVVLKLVKFCVPVRTDKFELLVLNNGELVVQNSEVWSKLDGACI